MNRYYFTVGRAISFFNLPSAHAALNLVYSQDFNSAAAGTTGSGLNDGSFMVGSGHTVQVYDWQSQFKALWLTPMGAGTLMSLSTTYKCPPCPSHPPMPPWPACSPSGLPRSAAGFRKPTESKTDWSGATAALNPASRLCMADSPKKNIQSAVLDE